MLDDAVEALRPQDGVEALAGGRPSPRSVPPPTKARLLPLRADSRRTSAASSTRRRLEDDLRDGRRGSRRRRSRPRRREQRSLRATPRPRAPSGAARTDPGRSPQRRGVGKTLPGLSSAVRIERAAHEAHRLEVLLREHLGHVGGLVGAHAVLAGDRAAVAHAHPQDLAAELLGRPAPGPARARRRGRAGGGCRRRRGRRSRRAGPASAASSAISRSTSAISERGMTPSWTM